MRPNEGMRFGNFIRKIEEIDPESEISKEANRALTKLYKALVEGDEWPTKVMIEAFSWPPMIEALGKDRSEVYRFSTMTFEDPRNDVENLLMLRKVAWHFITTRQDLRGYPFPKELIELFVTYNVMTSPLNWTLPRGPFGNGDR